MWLALLGSLWASAVETSSAPELRNRLKLGAARVRVQPGVAGWTSKAATIAGHTVLDTKGERFYHATTNLSAVLRSGRLLSRRDLQRAGAAAAGLGGGPMNEAADQVSLAVGRDAADRVAAGLRLMARVVRGEVDGPTALAELDRLDSAVMDDVDRDLDEAIQGAEENLDETEMEVFDQVSADLAAARAALETAQEPREVYLGVVGVESALSAARQTLGDYSLLTEGGVGPIGFTVPFDRFRVDPDEVGVVEVAVRQGAWMDVVPAEAEVRVRPDDTRVLRAWRAPRGR